MKFNIKAISLVVIFCCALPFVSQAQDGEKYNHSSHTYKEALELFDKEKYASAQEKFRLYIDQNSDKDKELVANAEYYYAICAIELFHDDAEYHISRFISRHPESNKVNLAYFHMGIFQYRNENFKKVIQWFDKIEREKLSNEQLAEYYFRKGYSFFQTDQMERANQEFYEIKDKNTKFSAPALYYYSHIAYKQKNYQTALEGFQQLTGDRTFAPIMPYYITHIYYLQDKYKKVIEYAPDYVESATAKRLPEIAKIIGDSYFELQQYDSSLTYLQLHKKKVKSLTREDYYQLGYVAYKLDKYDLAIDNFEAVTNKEDKLAQNAYYHLADCYLSQDNKNKAKFAFEFASKMDFDEQIQQNALFNYAKITYQMRNTPFNDAIDAFEKYIDLYPGSENIDEAYNYLVKAYLHSNNYKSALESLDEVTELDMPLKKAYQKVAYFRGLELFNNRHYDDAVIVLSKSLNYQDFDKKIAALAYYWKAEAYYQLDSFRRAEKNYQEFIVSPGAFTTDEYLKAHYNLAYTAFKTEDYPKSIKWFRKFLNLNKNKETEYLADAYNRLGDCYFIRRSYWLAIEYYDKARDLDIRGQDYAMFQRAFALGLLKRPQKKINSLKKLIETYPESSFRDDAYFELGKSYLTTDNSEKSEQYFEKLVNNYPSSKYVKKSLVQLGLINYNQNDNQESLKYYKRVVAEYPGTEEAKNSLTGIKNIYVDMNQVDKYFAYVNGLGNFARVSMSEKDSLTYTSAEKIYMKDDCRSAIEFFKKYLQKFKNGNFAVNAHFYLADCFHRQKDTAMALAHYDKVIDKPKNNFTEQALASASELYWQRGNDDKALENFKKLEKVAEVHRNLIRSRVGQMRIHYKQKDFKKALDAANKVLHTEKINSREKREAHFIKAKALFNNEKYDQALKQFRQIAVDVNSDEGAEAKYRMAQIYYKKGEYGVAENEIFDFVEQNTSQEYWKAKSFILLADVYDEKGDKFQAKHTLKSIIDNYEATSEEDKIIETAKSRYNKLVEEEKYNMKQDTTQQKMEIKFDESGGK